jgi:osmotically-inducible protein OsmY
MNGYNPREINRYSRENMSHYWSGDDSYGTNYGDDARPYGEDYGEDTGHGDGDFHFDRPRRNIHNYAQSTRYNDVNEREGYPARNDSTRGTYPDRYSDPWYDEGAYYQGKQGWWERTKDQFRSWLGDRNTEHQRSPGRSNKGKGPRNYVRRDERITEDINDRLTYDPYVDSSDVDVSVHSGDVILSGTVDARTSKHRIEDICESVSGVRNVENRLIVRSVR